MVNQIKKCYQRCGLTELNCHIAPVINIDGGFSVSLDAIFLAPDSNRRAFDHFELNRSAKNG